MLPENLDANKLPPPLDLSDSHYFLGLDLGKLRDFTALAIVERAHRPAGEFDFVFWRPRMATCFSLRYLHRFPLLTPYPQIVQAVAALLLAPPLFGCSTLVLDATGVGAAVVDLFRAAAPSCRIVPVVFTSGAHSHSHSQAEHVPKADLIAALQLALQCQLLSISPHLPELHALRRELRALTQRLTASGRLAFSPRPSRSHDDLLTALALAIWKAKPHKTCPAPRSISRPASPSPSGKPSPTKPIPSPPPNPNQGSCDSHLPTPSAAAGAVKAQRIPQARIN